MLYIIFYILYIIFYILYIISIIYNYIYNIMYLYILITLNIIYIVYYIYNIFYIILYLYVIHIYIYILGQLPVRSPSFQWGGCQTKMGIATTPDHQGLVVGFHQKVLGFHQSVHTACICLPELMGLFGDRSRIETRVYFRKRMEW